MKITEAPAAAAAPGRLTYLFALPGIVFVLITIVLVMGPPLGFDPVWRWQPLTLAEAAGLRDDGEMLRLLRAGADPNAPGPVRADFIKSNALTLTPLEAAVGIRRADTVQFLLDHGAVVDEAAWVRLVCFARQEHATDVEALLTQHRPAAAAFDTCTGVKTPW